MRNGIKLGKLFGIQITLDLSWIVIFLLVSWNLTMVFATWHHAWSLLESGVLAVIAALLFFGSVLAHELAHSLVARSFGVPVSEIRLFLFGGVSNLAQEPPSPGAEFATTIVGPITSIGFGVIMLAVGSLFAPSMTSGADVPTILSGLGPVPTLLLWLGAINIGVGVFNLIPGFPLDGGRILRAIVWSATRNMRKATLVASTVGQITGWVFVALGVGMFFGLRLPFFGTGYVSGLWLGFIGWFLASAARSSYQGVFLHEALEGVTVSQLMRRVEHTLPPDMTVSDAVDAWFMRTSSDAYLVTNGDELLGIVTAGDVRRVPREDWQARRISDVMTPVERLSLATPGEPAGVALGKLATANVEQLPVVDAGSRRVVGLLDRRDVARWLELRIGPALQHRHA